MGRMLRGMFLELQRLKLRRVCMTTLRVGRKGLVTWDFCLRLVGARRKWRERFVRLTPSWNLKLRRACRLNIQRQGACHPWVVDRDLNEWAQRAGPSKLRSFLRASSVNKPRLYMVNLWLWGRRSLREVWRLRRRKIVLVARP